MKIDIVRGKLHRVGGAFPLDGRVSWVPADATGFQPANCYVLLSGDRPLLIDPGITYVEDEVMQGLRELIPPGAPVEVLLTRPQDDCDANLAAIADLYEVAVVHTVPIINPFDAFDALPRGADRFPEVRWPDPAPLEVIRPQLRLLGTFWGHDAETKTLFTSDSFTHAVLSRRDDRPLLDSLDDDPTTIEDVRGHLHATFPWLPGAVTWPIAENLRLLFDEHEIETIAPSRGCVLQGEGVVARHLEFVLDALTEPALVV
jgi:flavorubredoxin